MVQMVCNLLSDFFLQASRQIINAAAVTATGLSTICQHVSRMDGTKHDMTGVKKLLLKSEKKC